MAIEMLSAGVALPTTILQALVLFVEALAAPLPLPFPIPGRNRGVVLIVATCAFVLFASTTTAFPVLLPASPADRLTLGHFSRGRARPGSGLLYTRPIRNSHGQQQWTRNRWRCQQPKVVLDERGSSKRIDVLERLGGPAHATPHGRVSKGGFKQTIPDSGTASQMEQMERAAGFVNLAGCINVRLTNHGTGSPKST